MTRTHPAGRIATGHRIDEDVSGEHGEEHGVEASARLRLSDGEVSPQI